MAADLHPGPAGKRPSTLAFAVVIASIELNVLIDIIKKTTDVLVVVRGECLKFMVQLALYND